MTGVSGKEYASAPALFTRGVNTNRALEEGTAYRIYPTFESTKAALSVAKGLERLIRREPCYLREKHA